MAPLTEGRTAHTATRVEDILATLEFLPEKEDPKLRAQIKDAADHGISFLLRAQISSGPLAGGMLGAIVGEAYTSTEILSTLFNTRYAMATISAGIWLGRIGNGNA